MNALVLAAIPLAVALVGLAGWIAYLRFCRFLVRETKDAKSLEYAATAARAYREGWPGHLARAIGKLVGRSKSVG